MAQTLRETTTEDLKATINLFVLNARNVKIESLDEICINAMNVANELERRIGINTYSNDARHTINAMVKK